MVVSREEGRQFDVIFGDLTDIPVHGNDTSTWNFVRWTFPQCLVTTTFPQCILTSFSLDRKTFYLSIVSALNGLFYNAWSQLLLS